MIRLAAVPSLSCQLFTDYRHPFHIHLLLTFQTNNLQVFYCTIFPIPSIRLPLSFLLPSIQPWLDSIDLFSLFAGSRRKSSSSTLLRVLKSAYITRDGRYFLLSFLSSSQSLLFIFPRMPKSHSISSFHRAIVTDFCSPSSTRILRAPTGRLASPHCTRTRATRRAFLFPLSCPWSRPLAPMARLVPTLPARI